MPVNRARSMLNDNATSENPAVIAVVVDREGTVADFTPGFREVTGRSPERLRDSSLWEFVSVNDRGRMRHVMTRVATDRKPRRVDAALAVGSDTRCIAWSCSFAPRAGVDTIVAWGV